MKTGADDAFVAELRRRLKAWEPDAAEELAAGLRVPLPDRARQLSFELEPEPLSTPFPLLVLVLDERGTEVAEPLRPLRRVLFSTEELAAFTFGGVDVSERQGPSMDAFIRSVFRAAQPALSVEAVFQTEAGDEVVLARAPRAVCATSPKR